MLGTSAPPRVLSQIGFLLKAIPFRAEDLDTCGTTYSFMTSTQPLTSPVSAAAVSDELSVTFGAWLICACVACTLFGLTTHQTYRYFRLYPKDGRMLKLLVMALLVLDATHTFTNIHLCYYYLVVNYLNPSSLLSGVWSLRIGITETALVMLLSHSFFLRRIFLLGERRIFPVLVIGFLMVSEFAFAIAVTVMTFVLVTFEGFADHMWMIWTMLANAVVLDVLVTGCLIYYLWRSRTGFKRTDNLLDVLMVYTINTGLSTILLTLPAMICSIVMPQNLIWSSIYVIASKMYANSLLAVLNSRRSLIDKGLEGFETGSFGLQVMDERDVVRPLDLALKSPQSLPLRAARYPAPAHADRDTPAAHPDHKVANRDRDRVIDIKVTTETFVDVLPPRRHPLLHGQHHCPSGSETGTGSGSSASSLRGHAPQTRSGSGSGASLLAGAEDRYDGHESV